MTFSLEIQLDNEVFSIFDDENRKDISEILRAAADQIESGPHWSLDLNWKGEPVGKAMIIVEQQPSWRGRQGQRELNHEQKERLDDETYD